jgi:uncharacterized protein YbjT (DUF2867 family)
MTTTLVLGATGTVGGEVARLLTTAGHTVRRATSRAAGPDHVHLDLVTQTGVDAALEGANAAFLMSPPGYVNQDELLGPVIERARAHGVRKVVLMTAMGADADPSAPMRRTELQLEGSGLAWNVIRPNWFMQNFHTYWLHGIREHSAILLSAGQASGSFIDARDIAASAAALLQRTDTEQQAFDLTGSEALNHEEVAAILSEASGRSIRYEAIG